ncbi:hypothetical protein ACTQ54_01920 [Fundicoccus sp. Sow4_H7]
MRLVREWSEQAFQRCGVESFVVHQLRVIDARIAQARIGAWEQSAV